MKTPESKIYLEKKLSNKNENIVKNNYLFANGVKSIKILPNNLPEYYVKINLADMNAYIKTKDVKYVLLVKREDHNVLYISYDKPIIKNDGIYEGFDLFIYDENIIVFLNQIKIYSNFEIDDIVSQLNCEE